MKPLQKHQFIDPFKCRDQDEISVFVTGSPVTVWYTCTYVPVCSEKQITSVQGTAVPETYYFFNKAQKHHHHQYCKTYAGCIMEHADERVPLHISSSAVVETMCSGLFLHASFFSIVKSTRRQQSEILLQVPQVMGKYETHNSGPM